MWWLGIGFFLAYLYPQNSTFGLRQCERRVQKKKGDKRTFSLASISKDFLLCVIRRGFGK